MLIIKGRHHINLAAYRLGGYHNVDVGFTINAFVS